MRSIKVLLLFGGESSEHEVSVISAKNVYEAIDKNAYEVSLAYISKDGKWYLLDSFDQYGSDNESRLLFPRLGSGSFIINDSTETLVPDVILPILHGKNGEDGSVQGLAQLLHIPIVGCDMTASSIGMDKLASKRIVESRGIKVAQYLTYRNGSKRLDYQTVVDTLGLPLFIKPTRAGSSVGVSKVHDEAEFFAAIGEGLKYDETVLIEKAINARELEIGILGTLPNFRVSGIGEIIPGEEFYSYDDKYSTASRATALIPADINTDIVSSIQDQAKIVYESLGCSGLSRIDFFLDQSGDIYFNEINTLPGFTNISMYPKLWQAEGMSYKDLISALISDAL